MKYIQHIRTTCQKKHVVKLEPVSVEGGMALFNSGTTWCSYVKRGGKTCEAKVLKRKAVYGAKRKSPRAA